MRQPDVFAIDAWIDSDGYPVVILTRALALTSDPVSLKDVLVRWAKVSISDGDTTVVMTGGMDSSVFPPFSYRSFKMKGEVGHTYRIEAEYEGVRASAVSTILEPGTLSDVSFEAINDSMRAATVTFRAPDTRDTCHFVLLSRVRGEEMRHYPSFLGAVTTTSPLQLKTVPLYRGKHVDSEDSYVSNFLVGDTIEVMLARIDPTVYRFWDAYQNEVYFGNNLFISSYASLEGNVTGGYGIFSARGVSKCQVIVK